MSLPQQDPPVDLKRPYLAALLAFLVPGAGHLYQGRLFKAGVYFFGIMFLFAWGMQIGQWKLLYRLDPMSRYDLRQEMIEAQTFDEIQNQWEPDDQSAPSRKNTRLHWPYIAQAPIGLFSLAAYLQEERYYSPSNAGASPEFSGMEEPVEGFLDYVDNDGNARELTVNGTIVLKPAKGEFGREIQGTFTGTANGTPVTAETQGEVRIGLPIGANDLREVTCRVTSVDGNPVPGGNLALGMERPWIDRFLVPPDFAEIQRLHGELGKKHTLAEVFTWIAGMLNVLAIWDAFAGPAYGYRLRRRKETDAEQKPGESNDAGQSETTAAQPTSATPA